MTCKFYDEELCRDDCKEDWCKCDICGSYIEPNGDEEPNGYIIHSAVITCDDYGIEDKELEICPKCFEEIKSLKKERETVISRKEDEK